MSGADERGSRVSADASTESAAVLHVLAAVQGTDVVERALPPAFEGLVRHNRSTLVSAEPLTVSGEAPFGGYLATLDRTKRPVGDGLEALQVRLRVRQGTVGLGLLNAEGTTFLDTVDGFERGDIAVVTFLIRRLQHVGPLVIRNAGHSRVIVELLTAESFQLKDATQLIGTHAFPDEVKPFPGWNRYYGRFGATPAEGVRQLLFDELREPFVMKWRSDLQVVITPGEETSRALFVSGTYEPASMLALQRVLWPGAVMFDVGANVGLCTLAGATRVGAMGHVYAFEPSSRERVTLEKNVTLNRCGNVTIIPAAAADRSGAGTLRVAAGQHRGQNTLAPIFAYPSVSVEREEAVPLVSLDDLWRARTVRLPDVLKIDVEGSELQVLRGATAVLRESMPVVIFEINDTLLEASGASRAEVGQFLTALGYTLHRLDDATAALVPVATLAGVDSENFVALPPHKASRN